jgi:TolB protein
MNVTRYSIPVVAALTLATAGGCGFGQPQSKQSTMVKAATSLAPAPIVQSAAEQRPLESQTETAAATRRAPAPPSSAANPTLVRLFGELPEGRTVVPDSLRPVESGGGSLSQVSFAVEGACFDPAVDPTGTRIAFASTMHSPAANIYIKPVTGATVTQLTSGPSDDVMPAFDPSGTRVAFASNRSGQWNIYVTSIGGGLPAQLTSDGDPEIHPTWSPDGKMIAFCRFSSQSGRWEIWALDVDSPGVRHFLDYGMFPKWSPNAERSRILFQKPRQRGSRLHGVWTIDYANGQAMHPTEIVSAANAAVINPAWSPDGRRIVFVTVVEPERGLPTLSTPARAASIAGPEHSDIWVINADGSGRVRLTDGQHANFQPAWGADGRIYFVSNRSGVENIWAAVEEFFDGNSGEGRFVGAGRE